MRWRKEGRKERREEGREGGKKGGGEERRGQEKRGGKKKSRRAGRERDLLIRALAMTSKAAVVATAWICSGRRTEEKIV